MLAATLGLYTLVATAVQEYPFWLSMLVGISEFALSYMVIFRSP